MIKRVVPLLIALAVAGAPVALEACRIACGSSVDHSSCHEHRGEARLIPQVSPCDHGAEATASRVAARNSDNVFSLAAAVPAAGAVEGTRDLVPVPLSALANRLELHLAIPLRI